MQARKSPSCQHLTKNQWSDQCDTHLTSMPKLKRCHASVVYEEGSNKDQVENLTSASPRTKASINLPNKAIKFSLSRIDLTNLALCAVDIAVVDHSELFMEKLHVVHVILWSVEFLFTDRACPVAGSMVTLLLQCNNAVSHIFCCLDALLLMDLWQRQNSCKHLSILWISSLPHKTDTWSIPVVLCILPGRAWSQCKNKQAALLFKGLKILQILGPAFQFLAHGHFQDMHSQWCTFHKACLHTWFPPQRKMTLVPYHRNNI